MDKFRTAAIITVATLFIVAWFSVRKITWTLDYNIEQKIVVKGTNWNAEIRSDRCIFSCASYQGTDIRLINDASKSIVVLVQGADVIEDQIQSVSSGQLEVTLSNLTVAKLNQISSVPGVNIIWNFTPRDDPAARAAHRAAYEINP